MKRLLALLPLLLLSACNDDAGARQAMAKCKLNPNAQVDAGMADVTFLANCMEAKGYIRDDTLYWSRGAKCADLMSAGEEAGCYRPDNWFESFMAKGRK